MPIKPVDIEELTSKAKNVHEAIVAMSKRARQINEETKIEFSQRIAMFAPKTESENEENEINPDQLKVSLEFEKRPKPTDVALDELLHEKLQWRYKEPEEVKKVETEEDVADSSDDE
ncbi:DNA-directed RNA polymerase subunit omega [Sphingobacteriales bacterium CHB3]|nr:DNA-directed RNA polymerase subunit omega [Sphingobacteriales bacterium CHB3]